MSELKQYGLVTDLEGNVSFDQDDNGNYVLYSDVQKLKAENIKLKAELANMRRPKTEWRSSTLTEQKSDFLGRTHVPTIATNSADDHAREFEVYKDFFTFVALLPMCTNIVTEDQLLTSIYRKRDETEVKLDKLTPKKRG